MADPTPDLIRAGRAGCDKAWDYGPDHPCIFPLCKGCKEGTFFHAALAELATPSEEMVAAAAFGMAPANICRSIWRAMMRHILGGDND